MVAEAGQRLLNVSEVKRSKVNGSDLKRLLNVSEIKRSQFNGSDFKRSMLMVLMSRDQRLMFLISKGQMLTVLMVRSD